MRCNMLILANHDAKYLRQNSFSSEVNVIETQDWVFVTLDFDMCTYSWKRQKL